MKKLLSVLVSISLINIVLLGATQGISEMEDLEQAMDIQLLKAEDVVSKLRVELSKNEESLSKFKQNLQLSKLHADTMNQFESKVNELRLAVISAEENLSVMREAALGTKTRLSLAKDVVEIFETLLEDYSSPDDEL